MKQPKSTFKNLLRKFFKFHKREVKQFNALIGAKPSTTSKKC